MNALYPLFQVGLAHWLVLAGILFALGVTCCVTRKNAVGVLMGVELVLNAATLNLIAFARYLYGGIESHVFTLFLIVLAAADAAVALAIVIALFLTTRTIDVTEATRLRQ
jgi:NADH-quinone oxidoreductase subunit K